MEDTGKNVSKSKSKPKEVLEEKEQIFVETLKSEKKSVKVIVIAGDKVICVDSEGHGIEVPAKAHRNAKVGDTIKI